MKKFVTILILINLIVSNANSIEPDVFVQSTVNRASEILSKNIIIVVCGYFFFKEAFFFVGAFFLFFLGAFFSKMAWASSKVICSAFVVFE